MQKHLKINDDLFQQALMECEKIEDNVTHENKKILLKYQRLSLTSMANQNSKRPSDSKSEENFHSFLTMCKFPLNVSVGVQNYVFLLKCMQSSTIDTATHVNMIITCPIVLRNIGKIEIVTPDTQKLIEIIKQIQNIGNPPSILKIFKTECLEKIISKSDLTWTLVLKLYMVKNAAAATIRKATTDQSAFAGCISTTVLLSPDMDRNSQKIL